MSLCTKSRSKKILFLLIDKLLTCVLNIILRVNPKNIGNELPLIFFSVFSTRSGLSLKNPIVKFAKRILPFVASHATVKHSPRCVNVAAVFLRRRKTYKKTVWVWGNLRVATLAINNVSAVNSAGAINGVVTNAWYIVVPISPDILIAAAISPKPVHL